MLIYLSGRFNKLDFISLAFVVTALFVSLTLIRNYFDTQISTLKTEVLLYKDALGSLKKKVATPRYSYARDYDRVDYHDYEFMRQEALRSGPGEHGRAFRLRDESQIEANRRSYEQTGFYGVVSDRISVNRSLPDVRHEKCKSKTYLKQLPTVSIIIVFYNEHPSMLKRALHSIYNRTPHKLIYEIILVNDNSTSPELYEPFEDYVIKNFADFVKIRVLNERRGMIVSRLEGARQAKGEVLVFLDAHIEVNVNWLPPLLEPIAFTPKIITTPIVDRFEHDTFEYKKLDDGGRGIFNWDLQYRRFPRRPEDNFKPDAPIPSPVMLGSAFAIHRQVFWDMGAYDAKLKVAQGENLEMSLKAHLCGRGMVECPCSRVAHSYRHHNYYKRFENGTDYAAYNLKRIVDVWFDNYADVVYSRNPKRFDSVEVGNLVRERTIRQGLHCKPFRYFIEYVAPEMLERYPIENPGYFTKGTIRSKSNTRLCVEVQFSSGDNEVDEAEADDADEGIVEGRSGELVLSNCDDNHVSPKNTKQSFSLTYHRNIQHSIHDYCVENTLELIECHFRGGNQLWRYDLETSQIINPLINATKCLTMNLDSRSLQMSECDESDINQKWNWGEKNLTALRNWETFGVELTSLELEEDDEGEETEVDGNAEDDYY